jgi:tyrosyl-tRNA synthetase
MNNNIKEINRLLEFISNSELEDINTIKKEIAESGIDLKDLANEAKNIIHTVHGKLKLAAANKRSQLIKEKLSEFQLINKSVTIETAKETLLSLFGKSGEPALQASFRKIESLSDKEAYEIFVEDQLLDFLNKIMDEE